MADLSTVNSLPSLLHHPKLYKKIHKKHHEWTAPIGVISLYAHPIEHVVSGARLPQRKGQRATPFPKVVSCTERDHTGSFFCPFNGYHLWLAYAG